jgi:hypothetical protein
MLCFARNALIVISPCAWRRMLTSCSSLNRASISSSGVPDRDAFEVVFGKGLLGAGAPSVEEWGWDFQKQLLALSRDL